MFKYLRIQIVHPCQAKCAWCSTHRKNPVFRELERSGEAEEFHALYLEVARRYLRKADLILSPSRFLQNMFSKNGLPAERITLIEFGMPGLPNDLQEPTRAIPRHERLRFGFIGSFMPHKGIHVLVKFAARRVT